MSKQYEKDLAERFQGKRVKRSWRSLRSLHDRVLSCGIASRKAVLQAEFDAQSEQRGTVTSILEEVPERGVACGLEVTWDGGTVSKCLPYMVDLAEDEKEN